MKKLTHEMAYREWRKLNAWSGEGVLTLKEEIYMQALEIALPILEQQEQDRDEWIKWEGGECPVNDSSVVEVKCRSGSEYDGWQAQVFYWAHLGEPLDIIAYRVVKP